MGVVVRHIEIHNFRSIRLLKWAPHEHLNCLIGPGDSGKSTILDAVDLCLLAGRRSVFTDADFYMLDVSNPIDIRVTLGMLDDVLKDLDIYGLYHRGWNSKDQIIEEEPGDDLETVLTVRLQVAANLEPVWGLFSERAEDAGHELDIKWAHRRSCAATRLGSYAAHHFAWGARSILNSLSDDAAETSDALAAAGRLARTSFAGGQIKGIQPTLDTVRQVANDVGVGIGQPQALLDIKEMSFGGASVALHDKNQLPLRSLGLGSSRLLLAGIQKRATERGSIALIDEVEHGLEPFRIVRLLTMLGSKDKVEAPQTLMTSHSPVVLRELEASQLNVLRQNPWDVNDNETPSHQVFPAGSVPDAQETIRACPEAFLARKVLVCEGRTEMGLVRGLDYFFIAQRKRSMSAMGMYPADGGGDNSIARALCFARLGYPTALFLDADKSHSTAQLMELRKEHVTIFQWESGSCTEDQLLRHFSSDAVVQMLNIAVKYSKAQSVENQIKVRCAFSLLDCRARFTDEMRDPLAKAANEFKWFKKLNIAEKIGRDVVGPNLRLTGKPFLLTLKALRRWVKFPSYSKKK